MSQKRRNVLKTLGAVGAGSVLAVGGVSANEENECVEVLDERSFTTGGPSLLLPEERVIPVNAGFGGGYWFRTEPFYSKPAAFARSEFEGRRAKIVVTWNSEDTGPTDGELEFEHRRDGGFVTVATADNGGGPGDLESENRIELMLYDGEYRDETEEEVVIDDSEEYRFGFLTTYGVADFEISIEFQTYDTDCPSFKL